MEILISAICGILTMLFVGFLARISDKNKNFWIIVWITLMLVFASMIWYGILFQQ
jgi:ABC-type iron transport system FetAB permease component